MFGFGLGKKDPITRFWNWFVANSAAIGRDARAVSETTPASKLIIHGIGGRLAEAHDGVVHEIGVDGDGVVELIISADGMRAAFPAVTALIAAAPRLPGFKFTAFRPRVGSNRLRMYGNDVGFEQVRFRSFPEGDRLGLDLFIDAEATPDEIRGIGFILLDMALGEYDVGTGVGSIEFRVGAPADAMPFEDLAAHFDAFRAQTVH